MRTWKLLFVAGVAISLSLTAVIRERSVRLSAAAPPAEKLPPFNVDESAALFVGVNEFREPSVEPIRYTVDDAIALAYAFAFRGKASFVRPERIALAVSERPQKETSRHFLAKLRSAGAQVFDTKQETIAALLERQSRAAGKGGMLIVFFASHGFSSEGTPYVLASTSLMQQRETSLSTAHVLDVVARSAARRSLIFIDACRERVPGKRGADRKPVNAAPMLAQLNRAAGQVVFYAAGPGGFSYEDPSVGHGVFTHALLDGLSCAARTTRGVVTVESLAEHVEEKVLQWVKKHRDPHALKATQVSMDPATKLMPLAACSAPESPVRVAIENNTLIAFGSQGAQLWRHTLAADIVDAQISDLDLDKVNDVVVGSGNDLIAFDAIGDALWTVHTAAPVRKLVIQNLYGVKHGRHVVALSGDDERSHLTLVDKDGTELAIHSYPGRLVDVLIDRQAATHDPKILAVARDHAGAIGLFAVKAPKLREPLPVTGTLGAGSELWHGTVSPPTQRLDRLQVIDYDNDSKRDIALHTATGGTIYLNFEGHVLKRANGAHFQLHPKK
jgi:uncharacterized caspase-like protein